MKNKALEIIYAVVLVLIFIVGIGCLIYGLFMIWKPLAYIVLGLLLCVIASALNQSYERKGGD